MQYAEGPRGEPSGRKLIVMGRTVFVLLGLRRSMVS